MDIRYHPCRLRTLIYANLRTTFAPIDDIDDAGDHESDTGQGAVKRADELYPRAYWGPLSC